MFLQSIITNKLLPSPKQNTFHLKNYPTQAIRGICASSIPNLYQTCKYKYDHSKQKKQQQQLPQHSISNINALIPNYEASVSKLFNSEMSQRIALTGTRVFGLYSNIHDSKNNWASMKSELTNSYLLSVASTIAAGTSEIQRNIIATRGLGLPRG